MLTTTARPFCDCTAKHQARLIVVTGGPGAGKTAVLEMARRQFCQHVAVLPEAAGILFGGGFPRLPGARERKAAQRAIFHVQRELERIALADGVAVVLCDRGTLDGLAYWPEGPESFFTELSTTLEDEMACYSAVIHLRTPSAHGGYVQTNPLRTESAAEAQIIDRRIAAAWQEHPRYVTVPSDGNFLAKAERALAAITDEVPACCESSDERRQTA
jgi:predicted ATPase